MFDPLRCNHDEKGNTKRMEQRRELRACLATKVRLMKGRETEPRSCLEGGLVCPTEKCRSASVCFVRVWVCVLVSVYVCASGC